MNIGLFFFLMNKWIVLFLYVNAISLILDDKNNKNSKHKHYSFINNQEKEKNETSSIKTGNYYTLFSDRKILSLYDLRQYV